MELTERDRAILDFERSWWTESGPKEAAIRERFELSATVTTRSSTSCSSPTRPTATTRWSSAASAACATVVAGPVTRLQATENPGR
jgi:hypothetical protein